MSVLANFLYLMCPLHIFSTLIFALFCGLSSPYYFARMLALVPLEFKGPSCLSPLSSRIYMYASLHAIFSFHLKKYKHGQSCVV